VFKASGMSMDLAVFSTVRVRRIVALLQELDAASATYRGQALETYSNWLSLNAGSRVRLPGIGSCTVHGLPRPRQSRQASLGPTRR
jgi:hypothetical protein